MEEKTRRLLQECCSGCIMGINSMEQVKEYVTEEKLGRVIDEYLEKNRNILGEIEKLLAEGGSQDKEPGAVASAFSWLTTEMKLMMKDDSSQIAKIMMDGSNMGIQSLCKYIHDYEGASEKSVSLAKKLVKTEEDFMKELQLFL